MEDNLSLLVVGSGGREFAIAKALLASPHVSTVYCAPGNVGMKAIGAQTVDIDEMDLDGLLDFAKKNQVAWTFVGPENVLCAGIVDKFHDAGQKIFGPNQRAAQLEGSKDYALQFMDKYGVPTAKHETFRSVEDAQEGLRDFGLPVVIKANGLAGGKGVVIAHDEEAAKQTIADQFQTGQSEVVLEECLVGPEYSLFLVISGDQFRVLPMAQDHKRAYDGDKGPNTGGMGAYSPLPQLSAADRQRMIDETAKPTVRGLVQGHYDYHGILYIGLMMTADGPKVIEYNVRLGDPETQVVLPRLQSDFAALVDAAVNDADLPVVSVNDQAILGVVLAAKGYPQHPQLGIDLGKMPEAPGITIDYANVKGTLDHLRGAGGRLMMVMARAGDVQSAQKQVYDYLAKLDEPHCFYRHDIGNRALQ